MNAAISLLTNVKHLLSLNCHFFGEFHFFGFFCVPERTIGLILHDNFITKKQKKQ